MGKQSEENSGAHPGTQSHMHSCSRYLLTRAHTLTRIHTHTRTHMPSPPLHKLIHTHSLSLQGQGGARPPRGWWVAGHPRGRAVVPSVQASKGQDEKSEKRVRRGGPPAMEVARADTGSAGNSEEKKVGDPSGA